MYKYSIFKYKYPNIQCSNIQYSNIQCSNIQYSNINIQIFSIKYSISNIPNILIRSMPNILNCLYYKARREDVKALTFYFIISLAPCNKLMP